MSGSFSLEERLQYLREYGCHCMSYSALQPGMHYFDVPGKGYLSYMYRWGTRAVLADPICHEADRLDILRAFISESPNCGFVQVSQPVAEMIHEHFNFYATQFGIESVVDLRTWNLKGKKKQILRTAANQALKQGVTVTEGYDETRDYELSRQWLQTRKVSRKEIIFLIRPMSMDYNVGTRKFYAYRGEELLGFIYFDPVYRGNRLIGYVPNISRFDQAFRQGIFYTIMVHAMDVFKEEGIEELHLGLAPLVTGDDDRPYEAWLVKKIIRFLYEYGNGIYNFKGIYFTKSRFNGVDSPTFCCHKSSVPLKKFLTVFKISNVF
ncbi:MAG: DUF2156 domain-containing protein [Deltaproteobacteria bacterium]|nr:DUF2156 domain-containing protein [Deltaproteobacteria bacterium]